MSWYGNKALVDAVLADPSTAPIPERLQVMLAFLRKLTLEPQSISTADVDALFRVELSDEAIEEAVYAATCFNIIDRLADAFDFRPNDERGLRWVARILLSAGYGAASVPG